MLAILQSNDVETGNIQLTLIVAVLLLSGIAAVLMPSRRETVIRTIGAASSAFVFLISAWLWIRGDWSLGELQWAQRLPWIEAIGLEWFVGVDGISMPLLASMSLVFVATHLVGANRPESDVGSARVHVVLLSAMQLGVTGVCIAADSVLFFASWQFVCIPAWLLIENGGLRVRSTSSIKMLAFLLGGSLLALLALLAIWSAARDVGATSLDFAQLLELAREDRLRGTTLFGWEFGTWTFWFLFVGFAMQAALFPFHVWLTEGQRHAPDSGTMLLGGVLVPIGLYGLMRLVFPFGASALGDPIAIQLIAIVAAVTVVYAAFVALAQESLAQVVCFAAVAQAGLVVLGLATLDERAWTGAAVMILGSGLSLALLGIVARLMDRQAQRSLAFFTIGAAALLGLPALILFVPRLLVWIGAFETQATRTSAVICLLGQLALVAAFAVHARRAIAHRGDETAPHALAGDPTFPALFCLAVPLIAFGLFPGLVVDLVEPAAANLLRLMGPAD